MKTKCILLVDDEPRVAATLVYTVEAAGFKVVTALDGDAGLRLFTQHSPDLVLLDLNLPGISGLDLLREMRRRRPQVPIIMLTARAEEMDRVVGLEVGADDYVTKPFSPREVAARVRAVLRRTEKPAETTPATALRYGPLRLDAEAFHLTCSGQPVVLTRQEFRLLEALVRHPARVFTRDTLMDLIYDGENVVSDRSIDAYVKRLRKKFTDLRSSVDPIQTVYGVGYKLNQDLE
jgi:DNA-binding response OmpR family regulator